MKTQVRTLWLPKEGNSAREYEDAFYPNNEIASEEAGPQSDLPSRNEIIREGELLPFAIADGAAEGVFSRRWAQMVAALLFEWERHNEEFSGEELGDEKFLAAACEDWEKWRNRYIDSREKQNRPVQWFEEEGLQAVAFSTFLGLKLKDSELLRKWDAIALGDSCLFQVRRNCLITKFPIEHSSDFNNQPFLFSSNPAKNSDALENIRKIEGDWQVDDQFYLMTDAIASWFLRENELGNEPWNVLSTEDIDQPKMFERLIDEFRENGQMRNDDVTLIKIRIIKEG